MDDPSSSAPAGREPKPQTPQPKARRSRWVAIVTGALSILIGLLYLVLVTVLDRSGPLLPPPPEAFADAALAPAPDQPPAPGAGGHDQGRPGV